MEHIIQFGIGIDDDRIREVIESKAEKEIMEELKTAATRAVFKYDEWRSQPTRCPTEFFTERVDAFLDKNRDELLRLAADRLVEKLVRTKAVKDMISDAVKSNE